jgi:hypothetical protein
MLGQRDIREKQIPKGNDRKKNESNGKDNCNRTRRSRSLWDDRQKGKSNCKRARRSRSLRDDNQKGNGKPNGNSKRNANATANATATANTGVSPLRIMMVP